MGWGPPCAADGKVPGPVCAPAAARADDAAPAHPARRHGGRSAPEPAVSPIARGPTLRPGAKARSAVLRRAGSLRLLREAAVAATHADRPLVEAEAALGSDAPGAPGPCRGRCRVTARPSATGRATSTGADERGIRLPASAPRADDTRGGLGSKVPGAT